jgi:DNA-binding CsgD family transcriptional regulator
MTTFDIQRYLQSLALQEVKQLCNPLEEHFGLTSFVYRKNFNDGTEINVSNQPEWVEYFYSNNELLKTSVFDKHPDNYQSGFVLWSQLKGHQEILERAKMFNIDHGVTIVKKVDDGVELCYFGTRSKNDDVVNYYLNNIDLLERFILYFKDQAADIIKKATRQKLIVLQDKFSAVNVLDEDIRAIKPSITHEEFIKATALKKYHLDGEFLGMVLSAREMDVISCLLRGMTSEETGKAIHLSSRTVEDYLTELRSKFNVKNKSQLICPKLRWDCYSNQFDVNLPIANHEAK